MNAIDTWDNAWREYIEALKGFDDLDLWQGEHFCECAGRAGQRLDDAKAVLRSLDLAFCKALSIYAH